MAKTRHSDSMAFLFDLDGTLVDSVYQHVLAWREATQAAGIELPVWRIHRQIGMSGGLMLNALARETGRPVSRKDAERIQLVHAEAFANQASSLRVLPGAQALLDTLAAHRVPHAIATSGRNTTHGMRSSCSRSIGTCRSSRATTSASRSPIPICSSPQGSGSGFP